VVWQPTARRRGRLLLGRRAGRGGPGEAPGCRTPGRRGGPGRTRGGAGRGGRWRAAWAALFVSAGGRAGRASPTPEVVQAPTSPPGGPPDRGGAPRRGRAGAGDPPRPSAAGPGPHPGDGADSVVSARWTSADEAAAPFRAVAGRELPRRRASRSTTDGPDARMHPRSAREHAPAGHLGVERRQTLAGASRRLYRRFPLRGRPSVSAIRRTVRAASQGGPPDTAR
jgi:hypothetical protein